MYFNLKYFFCELQRNIMLPGIILTKSIETGCKQVDPQKETCMEKNPAYCAYWLSKIEQ